MNKYKEKRKAKKSICRMKVKETKRKRDRKKRIRNRKVNKPKERQAQKKENETDRIETKREKTKRIAVNKHNVKQSETGELKYVFKLSYLCYKISFSISYNANKINITY